MTNARRAIHAYLSSDAYMSLQAFADDNGVSMSAVLEALAKTLKSKGSGATAHKELVAAARNVDASRRRRTRSTKTDD